MKVTLSELEAEARALQAEEPVQWEPFLYDPEDGRDPVALPPPGGLTLEQLGLFEEGMFAQAPTRMLRALVGDDERFDEIAKTLHVSELSGLMRRYQTNYGLGGPGEGRGSPGTSRGTAQLSKRTSRTSTRASA